MHQRDSSPSETLGPMTTLSFRQDYTCSASSELSGERFLLSVFDPCSPSEIRSASCMLFVQQRWLKDEKVVEQVRKDLASLDQLELDTTQPLDLDLEKDRSVPYPNQNFVKPLTLSPGKDDALCK